MISRRSRRNIRPVEPLNQFPITAAKGVDGTKNADSLDTVQELQNFDITPSGDAELRKPMVLRKKYSNDVLYAKILYDNKFRLVVTTDGRLTIEDITAANNSSQTIRYVWYNYDTEEEYASTAIPPETLFDCQNAQFVNTNTATVITNIGVDVASEFLKVNNSYVIYDPTLYAPKSPQYVPRTIQVFKSSTEANTFIVKINSPELNHLSSTDTIGLDANMALDNPYAIRDEYNSAAPSVKNVLAYADSEVSDTGDVTVNPQVVASTAATGDHQSVPNVNHATIPTGSYPVSAVEIEPDEDYPADFTSLGNPNLQTFRMVADFQLTQEANRAVPQRVIEAFTNSTIAFAKNIPIWVFRCDETKKKVTAYLYTLDVDITNVFDTQYSSKNLSHVYYKINITRTYRGFYGYSARTYYYPWTRYYEDDTGIVGVSNTAFPDSTDPGVVLPPSGYVCLNAVRNVLNAVCVGTTWVAEANAYTLEGRILRCIAPNSGLLNDPAYTDLGITCTTETLQGHSVLKIDTEDRYYDSYGVAYPYTARYCVGYPIAWGNHSDAHTCVAQKHNDEYVTHTPIVSLRQNGSHNESRALLNAYWDTYRYDNTEYPFSHSAGSDYVSPAESF